MSHRTGPRYSLEEGMSALGHVWTAPWQELFRRCCSIGRVRSAGLAAGPNALRGSGPNR